MLRKLVLPLLVAVLAAACSGSEGPGAGEPTLRDRYPAGPYGVTEGAILADLQFGNPDGTPFGLDQDVFKDSANRVLLITTTAGWCGACIEEQPKLRALHEDYAAHGFTAVAALFEDANGDPATGDQAAAWKQNYRLPFPVVTDQPFVLSAYYDESLTPLMMLVDVDDMKILEITTGFDEQLIRSVIEANLDL